MCFTYCSFIATHFLNYHIASLLLYWCFLVPLLTATPVKLEVLPASLAFWRLSEPANMNAASVLVHIQLNRTTSSSANRSRSSFGYTQLFVQRGKMPSHQRYEEYAFTDGSNVSLTIGVKLSDIRGMGVFVGVYSSNGGFYSINVRSLCLSSCLFVCAWLCRCVCSLPLMHCRSSLDSCWLPFYLG